MQACLGWRNSASVPEDHTPRPARAVTARRCAGGRLTARTYVAQDITGWVREQNFAGRADLARVPAEVGGLRDPA
ncbi:hypothetical protein ACU4GD_11775 [Cupriavidus basilensis]